MDKSIEIEIGQKTYKLEPTLQALIGINKRHGSLVECLNRIRAVDAEAVFKVIRDAAGLSERQYERMCEDAVSAGVMRIAGAAADYVAVLMNPTDEEPGESGEA